MFLNWRDFAKKSPLGLANPFVGWVAGEATETEPRSEVVHFLNRFIIVFFGAPKITSLNHSRVLTESFEDLAQKAPMKPMKFIAGKPFLL